MHNPVALFDAMQRILTSKHPKLDDGALTIQSWREFDIAEKKLSIPGAPFSGLPFAAPPVPHLLQLLHQQQLNGYVDERFIINHSMSISDRRSTVTVQAIRAVSMSSAAVDKQQTKQIHSI